MNSLSLTPPEDMIRQLCPGIPARGGAAGSTGTTGYSYSGSGRYNPYNLPAYGGVYNLARTGLEDQYSTARQNIISSLPKGGALENALSQLEMSRGESMGSLPAQLAAPIIENIMNQITGTAYGTSTSQSLSGMGSAASTLQNANNAYMAAQLQANMANSQSSGKGGLGALGYGLGTIGGSLLGGPAGGALGGMGGKAAGNATQGWTSVPTSPW